VQEEQKHIEKIDEENSGESGKSSLNNVMPPDQQGIL